MNFSIRRFAAFDPGPFQNRGNMRKNNSFLLPKSPVLSAFSGKMQEPDSSAANSRPPEGPIPGISPKEKHARRNRFPGQTPPKAREPPEARPSPAKGPARRKYRRTGSFSRCHPPVRFCAEGFQAKNPENRFLLHKYTLKLFCSALPPFPGPNKKRRFPTTPLLD